MSPALVPKLERVLSLLQTRQRSPKRYGACRVSTCIPLRGELAGYWAVKVSANWRVIFRFEDGNVVDVDLVDYH